MSASWTAELAELDRIRSDPEARPPSQDATVIAAEVERRAGIPKVARGDTREFLKNLDKIVRGDAVVGSE